METLFIPIKPMACPRPRFSKFGTYNSKRYTKWKTDCVIVIRNLYKKPPFQGAVWMHCDFLLKRPKSSKNKLPVVRPDGDNFLKSIWDVGNGLLWEDDSQIVDFKCRKVYDSREGIWIHFKEVP